MIVNVVQMLKTTKGFFLIFLFFTLIAFITYQNISSLMAESEGRQHAIELFSALEELQAGLKDMGSPEGKKRVDDAIGALQNLVRNNQDQQNRLSELRRLTGQRTETGPEEDLNGEIQKIISEMSDLQRQQLRQWEASGTAGVPDTRAIVILASLIGMLVVMLSLTLSRRELAQRRKAEETVKLLSTAVGQVTDLVLVTDAEGTIQSVNKAAEETMGYPAAKLIGKSREVLLSDREGDSSSTEDPKAPRPEEPFQAEVVGRKKSGELFTLHETVTPILETDGRITHFVSTGKDLTYQKSLEEKVDRLTHYDPLTGLPNRELFIEHLSRVIERTPKDSRIVAVMVADIDRFKLLNDVFGSDAGDELLKTVAARLTESLGESGFVARVGSDEFGAAVEGLTTTADAIHIATRMLKDVSRPIAVRGKNLFVTLGVGIALYPVNGANPVMLTKNAEAAVSQAKFRGRNNYQFYSKDITTKASAQLNLENNLFTALHNKEYLLNYQPYHELIAKKIAGAEALIKWKHAKLGLVAPAEFIPTLEDTGMIIDVGEWVLRTACRQLKEWDTRRSSFPVSVNLSGNQFRHKYLVNMVDGAIKDFSLDPGRLALEVTESTFMHDLDSACAVLKKLKDLGISISVDDFGTGYSSLSYLKKLPVDIVKIDRSFIKEVATDPDAASVVTAIVAMARSLNLKTIAEGVENEEQWKVLRLLRCDMGQGFYFSPPLPPDEIEKYLY
jgi:diguanylate cyclase (GGDEF)-like protein/PAS domain S-box-containing protein